jgi:hypothetical protein
VTADNDTSFLPILSSPPFPSHLNLCLLSILYRTCGFKIQAQKRPNRLSFLLVSALRLAGWDYFGAKHRFFLASYSSAPLNLSEAGEHPDRDRSTAPHTADFFRTGFVTQEDR